MAQPENEAKEPKQLTKGEQIAVWFLPNLGDVLFILVIVFLMWLRPSYLFGDGSTGWHLVVGDYVLRNGVPHKDLISCTFPNQPWIAYQWLWDAFTAIIVNLNNGDLNLLAVCMSCMIASLMMLLYGRCRAEGASFPLALLLIPLGCMIAAVHFLARPVVFNFFAVYFFAIWLEDYWRGALTGKKFLFRMAVFMLLWVNAHPGFMLGIAMCGLYLLCAIAAWLVSLKTDLNSIYLSRVKLLALTVALLAAETFATPYGIELHRYLKDHFFGNFSISSATHEYLSPVFHGAFQPACLELLIFLFVFGLAVSKTRLSMPRLLMCIVFIHLSLSAVRNMPLLVVVILPAISQLFSTIQIGPFVASSDRKFWWSDAIEKWNKMHQGYTENEFLCSKHALSVLVFLVLGALALNHGRFFDAQAFNCTWSAQDKPTKTLNYLMEQVKLGALDSKRGFNYDNWGGYIAFKTGNRVTIDDRADFYGERFVYRYTIVLMGLPEWKKQLDGAIYDDTELRGSSVQWVLVPKGTKIADLLKGEPDWGTPAIEDEISELFVCKKKE